MGTSISTKQLAPKIVGLKRTPTRHSSAQRYTLGTRLKVVVDVEVSQLREMDTVLIIAFFVIHLARRALSPLVLFYIKCIDVGLDRDVFCASITYNMQGSTLSIYSPLSGTSV